MKFRILAFLFPLAALLAFANPTQTYSLVTLQAISATGGGPDVRLHGFAGFGEAAIQTLNTAGSSPTLAMKLQESDWPVVGYSQTTVGATDNTLRSGATTNVKLGAKFTVAGSSTVSVKTVTLMLKQIGTIAASQTIQVDIFADSGGTPTGNSLGTSGTIDPTTVSTSGYVPVTFTFTNPVDLAAGSTYHFVLSGSYTASASNAINWRSLTVGSGGTFVTYNNTSWSATTTQSFEVYNTQYVFSDVTGGAFAGSTTGTSAWNRVLFYAPDRKAFGRVYFTIGGTGGPSYYVAGALMATPRDQ